LWEEGVMNYHISMVGYRGLAGVLTAFLFVIAFGCTQPPDPGVMETHTAQNLYDEAGKNSAFGDLDNALKQLDESESHCNLALQMTRSDYMRDRANLIKQDIAKLRSRIKAAQVESEAAKAKVAAKEAGIGTPAPAKPEDFWKRPGDTTAAATPTATGTQPTATHTDLTSEETRAAQAKLGSQKTGANVDNATEADFTKTGSKTSSGPPTVTTATAESADAVVVSSIEKKGKSVVVHVVFNNKAGKGVTLGSVTGGLRDENDHDFQSLYTGFLEKGFKANWEDIFASQGDGLAAGEAGVEGGGRISFVLVGQVDNPDRVKGAVVTVTLQNEEKFSGKGPK